MVLAVIIAAASVFAGCGDTKQKDASLTTAQSSQAATASHAAPGDAHWFDDAVFLGDSVTKMLDIYCADDPEALGDAKFVCAGSLGFTNAQWDIDAEDNVHPTYRGKTVLAENCAKETGANKGFIMLGMNDIGVYGLDGSMDACKSLVDKIRKNSPDVAIYIQSVTPKLSTHEDEVIYNELIRDFDAKLEEYCKENDFKYLDIYNVVCDGDGALRPEYCGDPEPASEGGQGIHFTNEACRIWVEYLKNNV